MPMAKIARSLFVILPRPAVLFASLALTLGILIACEAEPTPTPTPLPTPTPTATPTPEPVMESPDVVLGGDILPLLPPEEIECVKAAVGEDLYNVLLQTPFTLDMLTEEAAAASPVTTCLSEESQAIFAQAVTGAGG